MRHRTENEIEAYQEGFDFCFNKFCECLQVEGIKAPETIRKMEIYRTGVQNASEPKTEDVIKTFEEYMKRKNRR